MSPADTPDARVTLRPATPADIPAIGRLGAYLLREFHDFDPQRFIAAGPDTEQGYGRYLGTQIGKADVILLVAEQGGEVAGYVYAGMEGWDFMAFRAPAGAVYDIVVDPERQARGVGRMLLGAALAGLRARGAPRVVLSTAEHNERAKRFFAAAGFRRTMVEMTREMEDETP